MKKTIKSIADVRTGYQFRGKVVHDDQGDIDVIQIKDIDELQEIATDDLTTVSLENPERHFVQPGDVLFLSRGHRMYGTIVPELRRPTVASSYFFVLNTKKDKVCPRYLAWFLNEPGFQRRVHSLVRGSHMPLISRTDFIALQVDIPDLHTQQKIARINELMLREARLIDQLKSKRAELIEAISRKLMTGSLKTKDQ